MQIGGKISTIISSISSRTLTLVQVQELVLAVLVKKLLRSVKIWNSCHRKYTCPVDCGVQPSVMSSTNAIQSQCNSVLPHCGHGTWRQESSYHVQRADDFLILLHISTDIK